MEPIGGTYATTARFYSNVPEFDEPCHRIFVLALAGETPADVRELA